MAKGKGRDDPTESSGIPAVEQDHRGDQNERINEQVYKAGKNSKQSKHRVSDNKKK